MMRVLVDHSSEHNNVTDVSIRPNRWQRLAGGRLTDHARTRAAIELGVLLLTLLLLIWLPGRHTFGRPLVNVGMMIVAGVMVIILRMGRPCLKGFGLRPASWHAGLWSITLFTLASVLLLALIGRITGCQGDVTLTNIWWLKNWQVQIIQQVLLNVMVAPRVAILLGQNGRWASFYSAGLFALLHLPNPILTPLTLLAGFFWAEWFRRHQNLPAVALSHMVLGWATFYFLSSEILFLMRVGIRY